MFYDVVDKQHIKKERQKASELKKTQWWKSKLQEGLCHYCGKIFLPEDLTMDHIVPLARGGKSTKGNTIPSCKQCNTSKGLDTPVEAILNKIKKD